MRALKTACTLTLLLLLNTVKGQNTSSITGAVRDSLLQPVPFAAVSLLKMPDSVLVKGAISNESGAFVFTNIQPGDYRVAIYLTGYRKLTLPAFHLAEDETRKLGDVILKTASSELKQAEVVSQKPFIEHFADKTVVNVENSIVSTGNSVYEVLERSPGVSIDQDGNISLRGKQGVSVLIDGKPTQMSAEQLSNYLRGMPSSAISKIELVTNPSSKYDAAGTAGIIDIKTKKGRKDGFNASVYSNYSQGRYGKTSSGFSFNAKYKKLNWFGNYDYSFRKGFYDLKMDRVFYTNGIATTEYDQHNYVIFPFNTHTAKLGCDFYASPKTTIGWVVNGSSNQFNPQGSSSSKALNGEEELQYYYNTVNHSHNVMQNATGNINFKHTIDTAGRELKADLDYAMYDNEVQQYFTNSYLNPDGSIYLPTNYVRSNVPGRLQIYSGKADYTHAFNSSLKLEAGIKSSYVTADNNVRFYNTVNGTESVDTTKSNHFLYNENINAAYVILNKNYKKINLQLGLRAEQTIAHGNQVTTGTVFDRNYAQLFPNVSMSYAFTESHQFIFNYSERINRPNYQSLNPFIIFVDPTMYRQGNPFLLPELSKMLDFGWSYKENASIAAYYSHNVHNIADVILQDDVKKISIQTQQNLVHVEYYGVTLNANFKPFNWWNSYNTIDIYTGSYNGVQQGRSYSRSNAVFSMNITNSFILPKGFTAELSGFCKTAEVYGTMKIKPMGSLNAGIKKTFMDNKFAVKLSANDIFYTSRISGTMQFYNINESFFRKNDTRIITLTVSYNIGKGGNSPAARRQTGDEEEKKRAANPGGN